MENENAESVLGTDEAPALEAEPVEPSDDGAEGPGPEQQQESAQDRKLTRENASLRKRLREIEAQVKAREEAELSEQERSQRRMVELEQALDAQRVALRDTRLRSAIAAESTALGIVDTDAAARLLDTSALDYDEDRGWEGVGDALRDLTHERPWLVSQQSQPAADANPANPARRRTRISRESLARMTQAEIDALPWEDVQAALAES